MAIEIKELHVRLFMGKGSEKDDGVGSGETAATDPCAELEKQDQMVQDTAREVLRLLKLEERR